MKKYYLLLLIIILNSCSNNESEPNDFQAQDSLRGRWNWVQSATQFNTTPVTPAQLNTRIVLEFYGTSYKQYSNGILDFNRTFFVEKRPSIYGGEKNIFVFKDGSTLGDNISTFRAIGSNSFEIIGDKLYIREELTGGVISEYERAKEYQELNQSL